MSRARLTLDNQVFSGTQRYTQRSASYERRTVQRVEQGSMGARQRSSLQVVRRTSEKHCRKPVFMDIKPPSPALSVHQRNHIKPRLTQQPATIQPRPARSKRRNQRLRRVLHRQNMLYAGAIVVFGLGLYAGLGGLRANKQVAVQVEALQTQAVQGATDEGNTDETVPPSTEKPAPSVVRAYSVAPVNPRYIDIPKLNVHARILSMGVDEHNELKAPRGIYDAGWYNASSRPGENGAMLVDGHSGIGGTRGIFHDLTKLTSGDAITIERGDGQVFTYSVVDVKVLDVAQVDMSALLVSADTSRPGLSLITCAGNQVPGTFNLTQRVVVRAVR
ncbi:hypothetical protein CSA80_02760 [Candidatus Saccharibacteria bacterium]|nr:MAG: hypothetical protein CR973_02875 [Candidatus Saccharibacteria bacterium]PID99012.1 MAG: hypothetical protein CSA80_02760 [Candidatus Saccharibacteria bacterium]